MDCVLVLDAAKAAPSSCVLAIVAADSPVTCRALRATPLASPRVHPEEIRVDAEGLGDALSEVAARGGGPVQWWVPNPTEEADRAAAAHGLRRGRDIWQLAMPLPAAAPPPLTVRSFVPGEDDDEWLSVNNRAFQGHAEQGGWGPADLGRRMAEPWFDSAGFLLHHEGERLAGFVWTKVHPDAVGEIFVIGVDPAFAGQGLGKTLTLVGLDWLHRQRRCATGMLYVDADNTKATTMYARLGFERDHVDRSFHGHVEAKGSDH